MDTKSKMGLLQLPQELLQYIVRFVDDYDLKNLQLTCSILYKVSDETFLWKARCTRFLYWEDPLHSPLSSGWNDSLNWKDIFTRRLAIEQKTTILMEAIIASPHGRIGNFEGITIYGYDAKDCLLAHLNVPDTVEDVLARRYHARAAISCIHRQRAVKEWSKIAKGEDTSLLVAMCGFDLFVLETPQSDTAYISLRIDEMIDRFWSIHENLDEMNLKSRALLLVDFMRREGFQGTSLEAYYDLRNSFLGHAVRHHKTTLPIVSCVLFCALASRLQIEAYPCEVSYHVYTIVVLEDGKYLYLDPYRHSKPVDDEDLKLHLPEFEGALGIEDIPVYFKPAPARNLILRSAANIQNSIYRGSGASMTSSTSISRGAAEYAAISAFALLGGNMSARILESLCRCLHEEYTVDIGFVEHEILPILNVKQATLLKRFCDALRNEDKTMKRENRRITAEEQAIRYSVGTVFRHKKYPYEGIITGWTTNYTEHDLPDETSRMQQPFYYALTDDSSMRYVAEENISEIRPQDGGNLINIAGKYFKRYDKEKGKYISNIVQEYPDD